MSFDDVLKERLRFFELADLDESELELLCHRKATLDTCRFYTSNFFANQNSVLEGLENLLLYTRM